MSVLKAPTPKQIEEFKNLKSTDTVWVTLHKAVEFGSPVMCEDGVWRMPVPADDPSAAGWLMRMQVRSRYNNNYEAAEDWTHTAKFNSCRGRDLTPDELSQIGDPDEITGYSLLSSTEATVCTADGSTHRVAKADWMVKFGRQPVTGYRLKDVGIDATIANDLDS